jgi:hypothetical protein
MAASSDAYWERYITIRDNPDLSAQQNAINRARFQVMLPWEEIPTSIANDRAITTCLTTARLQDPTLASIGKQTLPFVRLGFGTLVQKSM